MSLSDKIEIFNPKEDGFIMMEESCLSLKHVKESVKKLKDWIDFVNGDGKYFMSLGIDKLKEQINEIFGDKLVEREK